MTFSIDITGDALLTALRTFLLSAFAAEVVQGQANRVAMPQGNFIEMTPLLTADLSTARSTYTPAQQLQSIANPVKWTCQLDFYGDAAADNAAIFKTVIRTAYACDQFAASGLVFQPLYASDARNTAMINGEQQYESRYTLEFVGQFTPIVSVTQASALSLQVDLVEVDEHFPPT